MKPMDSLPSLCLSTKGMNQADIALAASVLIIAFSFSLSHISDHYSATIRDTYRGEGQNQAENLWYTSFSHKGNPRTWHWEENPERPSMGSTIWKVPVHIRERDGHGGTYTLKTNINTGQSNGLPNAWKGSVVAYHKDEALDTSVEGDGFMESFDILFEIEIGDHGEKTVDIYYSQNNMTEAEHPELEESENTTLNVTVHSERRLGSVCGYKAEILEDLNYGDLGQGYGFDGGFNISFDTSDMEFNHGRPIPEQSGVEIYSRKTLYQNKDGQIETIKPEVVVW